MNADALPEGAGAEEDAARDVRALRSALLDEARRDAAALRARARGEVQGILDAARDEAAERRATALAEAEARSRALALRARRAALAATREAVLEAESATLRELAAATLTRLRETRGSPAHESALAALVADACESLGASEVVVELDPEDSRWITRAGLERRLADRLERSPALELRSAPVGGGALVRAGHRLVDQTFPTRVERCLAELWPEISASLGGTAAHAPSTRRAGEEAPGR